MQKELLFYLIQSLIHLHFSTFLYNNPSFFVFTLWASKNLCIGKLLSFFSANDSRFVKVCSFVEKYIRRNNLLKLGNLKKFLQLTNASPHSNVIHAGKEIFLIERKKFLYSQIKMLNQGGEVPNSLTLKLHKSPLFILIKNIL